VYITDTSGGTEPLCRRCSIIHLRNMKGGYVNRIRVAL
jgi:hypothetical protein